MMAQGGGGVERWRPDQCVGLVIGRKRGEIYWVQTFGAPILK